MDALQQEIVNAVKAYARANYEMDGWDYIVECFSDEDILETIGQANTASAAIRNVGKVAKLQNSIREDVQGEIF